MCVCVFKEHMMNLCVVLVQEACWCLFWPVLVCILQTWAQTLGFYMNQCRLHGLVTRAFSWGSISWLSWLEVLIFLFEFVFCKCSLTRQWSCVPELEALVWVTASLGWVLFCFPLLTPPPRRTPETCAPAPAMAAAFSPWKGRLGVWNKSLLCLRTGHWYSCLHPGVSLRYLSGVTPLTQPSLRTQSRSLLVWRLQCSWGLCGACCTCGRGDAWLALPSCCTEGSLCRYSCAGRIVTLNSK